MIGVAGLTADYPAAPLRHPLLGRTAMTSLMPQDDPFLREKLTRLRVTARQFAKEYFQRYPKDRYMTEIESWRVLPGDCIEFTVRRLPSAD